MIKKFARNSLKSSVADSPKDSQMSVMSEIQRRAAPSRRFWPGSEKCVLWALTLLIGLLSIAPLMRLVWAAMAPEGAPDISRLSHLLGTRKVLTATLNTLTIAVVSTFLAMVLGTVAALLIALTNLRGKQAWVFTFILPLMIPPQVTALAWVQALSPSSPVLLWLGLTLPAGSPSPLYSLTGIIVLLGLHNA